ncbi:hypothetical protein HMI54_010212 [Coelomomyces lativittatus]|nr:hypothetical protein HMI56_002701 [Coelomomyces lativittatus]KAJ1516261.1 hypothetical protein HMI54_010212 [Coelomomyces lativittatus]
MPLPTETSNPKAASSRMQLKFLPSSSHSNSSKQLMHSSNSISSSPSQSTPSDATNFQSHLSHPSLNILPLAPSLSPPTFLINQRHSFSRLRQRIHQVTSKGPKLFQSTLNFPSVRELKQSLIEKETKSVETLAIQKQEDTSTSTLSFWSQTTTSSTTLAVSSKLELASKKTDSDTHLTKPILVLDLDETLIHSSLVPRRPSDFWIEVIQNNDMRTREIFWVYKRPGVDQFLRELSRVYQIYIFTAGIKEYASQILDQLDPEGTIFHGRFYRDDCTEIKGQGTFAKDLTKISDALHRMVLVDNTPTCYSLQPENGIPIKSWYTDLYDGHLHRLREFLTQVSTAPDLRHVISEWNMY